MFLDKEIENGLMVLLRREDVDEFIEIMSLMKERNDARKKKRPRLLLSSRVDGVVEAKAVAKIATDTKEGREEFKKYIKNMAKDHYMIYYDMGVQSTEMEERLKKIKDH